MVAKCPFPLYIFNGMRAPLRLMPRWSKEQLARIREIKRDFHVRAFGEEMARANLDMTKEERHRYLEWMREMARKNGVPPPRRPSMISRRNWKNRPDTANHHRKKRYGSSHSSG
jgi:hypothetical protein